MRGVEDGAAIGLDTFAEDPLADTEDCTALLLLVLLVVDDPEAVENFVITGTSTGKEAGGMIRAAGD